MSDANPELTIPLPIPCGEECKQQAEFLRVAYTRCTIRFNEIYTSVWSIFSYLAAGIGVLIGFAKGTAPAWLLWLGALAVVWTWYWVLFLPLNRYGSRVSEEAARLEDLINKDHFHGATGLKMFTEFEKRRISPRPTLWKRLRVERSRVEVRLTLALVAFTLFYGVAVACGAFAAPEHEVSKDLRGAMDMPSSRR